MEQTRELTDRRSTHEQSWHWIRRWKQHKTMRGVDKMVRTCSPHAVTFVSIQIPDGADDILNNDDVIIMMLTEHSIVDGLLQFIYNSIFSSCRWKYSTVGNCSAISFSSSWPSRELTVLLFLLLIFCSSVHKSRVLFVFMESASLILLCREAFCFKHFTARCYLARVCRITEASTQVGGGPQLTRTECQKREFTLRSLISEFHTALVLRPGLNFGKHWSPTDKQLSISWLHSLLITARCNSSELQVSVQYKTLLVNSVCSNTPLRTSLYCSICSRVMLEWIAMKLVYIRRRIVSWWLAADRFALNFFKVNHSKKPNSFGQEAKVRESMKWK